MRDWFFVDSSSVAFYCLFARILRGMRLLMVNKLANYANPVPDMDGLSKT